MHNKKITSTDQNAYTIHKPATRRAKVVLAEACKAPLVEARVVVVEELRLADPVADPVVDPLLVELPIVVVPPWVIVPPPTGVVVLALVSI